MFYALITH